MDLRTHIEFMTEYDERRLKDTMDMSPATELDSEGESDISFDPHCSLTVHCTW